jgi:hypothetical protein
MAIAFSVIWETLASHTGFFFSGTTTSTGTSTTIVDTSIVRYDVNILVNKWVYIITATESSIVGQSRRIASVASSTITLDSACAATTTGGDTYLIVPNHDSGDKPSQAWEFFSATHGEWSD